ncbi:MAG: hypothetical protein ACTSYD_10880 [Candidatus Heimdallarchaeaceae archaeon]
MIDEVRELLKRIDNIVDSEYRRFIDEIDELKTMLRNKEENKDNLDVLHEEIDYLMAELNNYKKMVSQLEKEITALKDYQKMANDLNLEVNKLKQQVNKLTEELNGLTFTVDVITEWIPSQKENIAVLVALSTSSNHSASFEEINKKTSIPLVTLKNRIIPILNSSSLVSVSGNTVSLTISNKNETKSHFGD